jgi:N-acetylmuramoyl-L-alanine amidase
MKIVISSGHGLHVRGASGIIDEVDEARRVTEQLADELRLRGVEVITYHDDISKSQNENLDRIITFHNSKLRDLDLSIHFNAFEQTDVPRGCEVWYKTQKTLAAKLSKAISQSGFIDRGAKQTSSLAFLNGTTMPACLLEICFVDSTADCAIYNKSFGEICADLADLVQVLPVLPPIEPQPPVSARLFEATGKCSHFGGPDDEGVDQDEGLAFFYELGDAPHLFLPQQPAGTSGLARRLNPDLFYLACRWDYELTPKAMLADPSLQARVVANGKQFLAWPADWGPHQDTGRVADLSPALMQALELQTDDAVEVMYPYAK